ncbi:FUSC family protein [Mycolicibacterium tokaiense]|uniref:Predicted membrane protein n=1 Tax=Mycolicibacterium tokaiense TaxID=39695 RepID=A0A378TAM3_9MYCO|nr:FUSC family protein [Mycolicibacterium tokaiense]STZ56586.1 Predicted membrane protein [Mycolicibacterium tokaiense]
MIALHHVSRSSAALQHALSPRSWRGALRADFRGASLGAPLRVGLAMAVVFVVGGLVHLHHLAGFAALGALVSAFCRPDPYPVRQGRLLMLAAGITASVGAGAVLGAAALPFAVDVVVIALLAGAAAYLMWALHIVGPGAVVFVFAAVGAQGAAGDAGDVARLTGMTVGGAVIGVAAAMAPWWLSRRPAANPTAAQRESLTSTLTRAPHAALAVRGLRIACAGALGATVAAGLGFDHPMWAAMGAVATMQGVGYHMTVQRGAQRLLGNIGGAVVAAALLALPLGYWGAVAAIIVFQIAAEVCAGVNYALTSLAVTPMALLLTGLGTGLAPAVAVDRIADTAIGIVVGIAVAAVAITSAEHRSLTAG